jgi:hypothetical protein
MHEAMVATGSTPSAAPLRLRSIALPVEHGGWGLLGEPLIVGLVLAPSWSGVGVSLFAAFAFLARHPLKLAIADRQAGRRTSRTLAAERFVLLYGSLSAIGVALAHTTFSLWWWPLAAAAPLALLQLGYDARHHGRLLLPELAGALAISSVAAAVLRAGGGTNVTSIVVWTLLATKAVGAILYVRARLRCDRGVAFARTGVLSTHAAFVTLTALLAARGVAPWLPAAAAVVLLARAAYGLSPLHRRVPPQRVGLMEMAYGIGFAASVAVGCAGGF